MKLELRTCHLKNILLDIYLDIYLALLLADGDIPVAVTSDTYYAS